MYAYVHDDAVALMYLLLFSPFLFVCRCRCHNTRPCRDDDDGGHGDGPFATQNDSARVSQAACELKTKRVFGLTGTLIQNDMKELWFLLHLIDPRAVGEKVI